MASTFYNRHTYRLVNRVEDDARATRRCERDPAAGDASVSARSAVLGDTITAGTHRYYLAYYRDPVVLGGCPAASTFNASDALDVTWSP